MPESLVLESNPIVLNPNLQAILDAPLPNLRRAALRREPRKLIASEVRSLLRSMGLKGISVTAPNYAQAQSIDVRLPRNSPEPTVRDGSHVFSDGTVNVTHHPVYRSAMNAAHVKLERIILAAFPDLDNRSDSRSDSFDYRLSIM